MLDFDRDRVPVSMKRKVAASATLLGLILLGPFMVWRFKETMEGFVILGLVLGVLSAAVTFFLIVSWIASTFLRPLDRR